MGVLAIKRCARVVLVLGLVGPALAFAADPPKRRPAPLVLVVGRDSPLANIELGALRSLFLGEAAKDPAGNKLTPLNQPPGSPDRIAFDRLALGMTPDEAGRYWVDRKIRGEGRAPRAFDSAVLLQRLVAKFPGAIAYVRADQVDGTVKPVRIDGRLSTDAGYALAE